MKIFCNQSIALSECFFRLRWNCYQYWLKELLVLKKFFNKFHEIIVVMVHTIEQSLWNLIKSIDCMTTRPNTLKESIWSTFPKCQGFSCESFQSFSIDMDFNFIEISSSTDQIYLLSIHQAISSAEYFIRQLTGILVNFIKL